MSSQAQPQLQGTALFGAKIVTPAGRLSYPKLWTPDRGKNGTDKPKYSTSLLVPQLPGITDEIVDACRKVASDFFGPFFKGRLSQFGQHQPIKNGDTKEDGDPAKGHWILVASCGEKSRPFVMDANSLAINDEDAIYGGCLAVLYVQAMAYNVNGFKGVKLFLQAVQKIGDGERFGNGGGDRFNPMNDVKKTEVPDYLRGALVASPPPRVSSPAPPSGVPSWSPAAGRSNDDIMVAAMEGDEIPF